MSARPISGLKNLLASGLHADSPARGVSFRRMTPKALMATAFIFVSLLASQQSQAELPSLCSHFAGPAKAGIPISQKTGVTKAEFDGVAAKIDRLYREEFRSRGGTLKMRANWESNSIDARANEFGWFWLVSLYGGLARQPGMTRDAFALVACHEVGHHLGGAPNAILSPLTNEGQADYYATLKCARRFFADEDNLAALRKTGVERYLASECRKEFSIVAEQYVCMRSGMAALNLTRALQKINGDKKRISFQTPDTSTPVLFSKASHPPAQCRLDTFLNGARCPVPVNEALSETSYWPGTCDRKNQPANTGSRPRCWFKPL
ncbi:MAG: hypothetical protein EOP05_17930 [Proteobacteria bacterium]|nr:MAG: hypothetical protein EOP05_17930 [Pseudomonadota bacterium]